MAVLIFLILINLKLKQKCANKLLFTHFKFYINSIAQLMLPKDIMMKGVRRGGPPKFNQGTNDHQINLFIRRVNVISKTQKVFYFKIDLPITILCTSLVPSYICVIFASLIIRSTWYSFTKP